MVRAHLTCVLVLSALTTACSSSSNASPSTPSPTPSPAPTGAATVNIPTNARTLGASAYVPNPVTISQGAVVTWSNTDSTTHDVVADGGSFDSGRMNQNGNFSFTFTQKGTYTYHCSIHPTMTGTVVVQ
jgi:plastocyanin